MNNYTIVKSSRNANLVLFQGYLHGLDRNRNCVSYYKCAKRPCPGYGQILDGTSTFILTKEHDHAANPEEVERRVTLSKLKTATSANPARRLNQTYNEVMRSRAEELANSGSTISLPPFQEIRCSLVRVRRKNQPPLPESIETLTLTEEMKMMDGEVFILQSGPILMFAKANMLQLLADASCIYMDGTFKVAPTLYTQLYTMHVMMGQTMICCAYFLLPNKSRDTYVQMLQMLQQRIAIPGTRFQIDFESAVISALKQVYPNSEIKGCFFHFTQCIWRKVQELGLVSQYNDKAETVVRKMVRRFAALPFLRPSDIEAGFDSAADLVDTLADDNNIDTMLIQLTGYVYDTWVKPEAKFPSDMWTRFNVPGPRTNNNLEGWHSGLKKSVGCVHPNIFRFIEAIKDQQKDFQLKVTQIQTGGTVTRRKKKYELIDNKLSEAFGHYMSGTYTVPQFLDISGAYFHLSS